jgi:xanthine dehydrogenase large subunit
MELLMRKLTGTDKQANKKSNRGAVGRSTKHESAEMHVTGKAVYTDDKLESLGQLHAAVGMATIASGNITSIDLSGVRAAKGVMAVITLDDIVGHTDIGPVFPGDPILTKDVVEFYGQAIFAVAATSHELAKKAVALANIKYKQTKPVLTIDEALAAKSFVRPPHSMKRGDSETAIKQAKHQLSGKIAIGGQEHFYLEGQIASVIPTEDGGMTVYSSSQHPAEVQKIVAEVLGIPFNRVVVDMKRMGGGFGGKETQAAGWSCLAAVLANKTQKAVKLRLNRSDDMMMTGKRHPFENHYQVGFNDKGIIEGIDLTVNGNCGYSPDLSDAIVDRAMFHADNGYYLDQVSITGNRCKTNTASNTAFRGFGGPQGMMIIECVMDDIAYSLGLDPLAVRKANLYGTDDRNITPYHQEVEHNNLSEMISKLEESARYTERLQEIDDFNASNKFIKKGISLTPVKFGISFTAQHLNQAGALINIYTDGSVDVTHGGTEMGQGLHTKIAQIVAQVFGIDVDHVKVSATRTDKVPNASPTAASSGTDLNGKAAQNAAQTIKQRLIDFAVEHFSVDSDDITFSGDAIEAGKDKISFVELVQKAYFARVSLSSTGFYRTPKIHYDRANATGRPFFYFAMGASVSEVLIDTLTGEYKLLQTDILHDVGDSLNPAIDIGQIEGGYIQGVGWLTSEELHWNDKGRLLTTGPATYKIPAISDAPKVFNVELLKDSPNREATIYHSKAVGEPPFMLAISVWSALRAAIANSVDVKDRVKGVVPSLDTPATPERVLNAVQLITVQQGIVENG